MPLGAAVTLRGERMYEFLDRLDLISLPRVRDFRGVSAKGLMEKETILLVLKSKLFFQKLITIKSIKLEVLVSQS